MLPPTRDGDDGRRRRHHRHCRGTEPALRLGLLMGLCGMLCGLLGIALLLDGGGPKRDTPVPTTSSAVFRPELQNLVALPIRDHRATDSDARDHPPPHHHHQQQQRQRDPSPPSRPTMTLVETLPVGNCDLATTLLSTHEVLVNLTQRATRSLDISAMYWNLLGLEDRKAHSDDDMRRFGADRGTQLFEALMDAARRGIDLRILTAGDTVAGLPAELARLVAVAPMNVHVRTWRGRDWYGGGILHHKLWIADGREAYVGSANMDWKSLAQVLEMGIVFRGLDQGPAEAVGRDLERLFEVWWRWCAPEFHTRFQPPVAYFSGRFQATLLVPGWSRSLPSATRLEDPFAAAGLWAMGNLSQQLVADFASDTFPSSPSARANLFVASAPSEATVSGSRVFDEVALVYTIRTAEKRVSLSVMDFVPFAMYPLTSHQGPIWWPALTDALLAGVFGKQGLHVRLLISQWQHTKPEMLEGLRRLQEQAALCQTMRAKCQGHMEIKIFRVPGWDNTTTTWPSFSRVNHAKFIVTDRRVNIGTSNMEWGYFYTTAGISVNTDHEETRAAMEGVFDRNWNSPYATLLP